MSAFRWHYRIGALIVLSIAVTLAWRLHSAATFEPQALIGYAARHPFSAPAIFLGIYAISVLACVPTLPLNLAAGFLWGPILGGLLATAGMALGAVMAFASARLLLGQPLAKRFDSRLVVWLQHELDAKGWRFVAFLRLNPVFPTGPLNYILGLTSIRMFTYAWATLLFLFPPAIAIAFLGQQIGGIYRDRQLPSVIHAVIWASAAVTVLVSIRYAAKYLNYRKSEDDRHAPGPDAQ